MCVAIAPYIGIDLMPAAHAHSSAPIVTGCVRVRVSWALDVCKSSHRDDEGLLVFVYQITFSHADDDDLVRLPVAASASVLEQIAFSHMCDGAVLACALSSQVMGV